jgi:hypothetical protein
MKKLLRSPTIQIFFAIVATLGLADLTIAAEKKDARVTQIIRDVRLLASKSGARPAAVNDQVGEGQAVRTGTESRAELTFNDLTVTRLGANTVFSYNAGAKEFDLASGAALICVPKAAGTVKINTAAATAAVTGFACMTEYNSKTGYKMIVIEGEACVRLRKQNPNDPCVRLGPGDLLSLPPNPSRFTEKKQVDLKRLVRTASLINGFSNKLPDWANNDILISVNNQPNTGGGSPPPGGSPPGDPTIDAQDQKAATEPSPTASQAPSISPPPGSPPPGKGVIRRPRG